MEQFIEMMKLAALGIKYAGVLIVIGAAALALVDLLIRPKDAALVKRQFASWILTGLEFIVAAEIITSTIVFKQEELLLLGAVVVIRITLGYALQKEMVASSS